jgi:hypothetical protein
MRDHEFVSNSYIVFRKDRREGKGGGVLLAIRPHLQPKRAPQFELPQIEIVWVTVKAEKLTLLIGSAYRAPNLKSEQNSQFLRALNLAASKMHEFDGLILMGDFNLDIIWAPHVPCAGRAPAAEFLSDFSESGWTQLMKGPARTTETGEIFTHTKVVTGVSDHNALSANLALNVVRPSPSRPPKTVFNFNRANWEQLELDLAQRLPQNFSDGYKYSM